MEAFFRSFNEATSSQSGYQLANTLLPTSQDQLRSFYRSTNAANVKKDIQYGLLYDKSSPFRLSKEKGNAWVDVYVAYWTAAGEIIRAEEAQKQHAQVSKAYNLHGRDTRSMCTVAGG